MSGKIFVNLRQRNTEGTRLPVEFLADWLATRSARARSTWTRRCPGKSYPEVLRAHVADAAVLLVVIHPGWLADLRTRADCRRD